MRVCRLGFRYAGACPHNACVLLYRVTRLGNFTPIGQFFWPTWGSIFCKLQKKSFPLKKFSISFDNIYAGQCKKTHLVTLFPASFLKHKAWTNCCMRTNFRLLSTRGESCSRRKFSHTLSLLTEKKEFFYSTIHSDSFHFSSFLCLGG
jgi:hypothetical protein